MGKDYAEILNEAMSILIDSRLENLPYDKTQACTIVNATNKDKGIYIVSDGTVEFEAFSEIADYEEGACVYVITPLNNSQYTKRIIGQYMTDNPTRPSMYTAPTEKIIKLYTLHNEPLSGSIAAMSTGSTALLGEFNLQAPIDTAVANTIVIKANFQTPEAWEAKRDFQGRYGIQLIADTDKGDRISIKMDNIDDMFGNTYGYVAPMLQQQGYDISRAKGRITNITLSLYQDGKLSSGGNISVSNIEVFFGADLASVKQYSVKVYTEDKLTYEDTEYERNIKLLWYNKSSSNKSIEFTDGVFTDESKAKGKTPVAADENVVYYWIDWLVDDINGDLTVLNQSGSEKSFMFECNVNLPITEATAVVWRNGTQYKADNTLVFKNISASKPGAPGDTELTLYCRTATMEPNVFLYGEYTFQDDITLNVEDDYISQDFSEEAVFSQFYNFNQREYSEKHVTYCYFATPSFFQINMESGSKTYGDGTWSYMDYEDNRYDESFPEGDDEYKTITFFVPVKVEQKFQKYFFQIAEENNQTQRIAPTPESPTNLHFYNHRDTEPDTAWFKAPPETEIENDKIKNPYLWCIHTKLDYTMDRADKVVWSEPSLLSGEKGEPGEGGTNGTKSESIRIYYRTKETSVYPPTANTTLETDATDNAWTVDELEGTSSCPYVFTSTGVKTTVYAANSPNDTTGETSYKDWTTPVLYRAYSGSSIDQLNYATYLRVTNFSTEDGLYYGSGIDDEKKLMINASFIKTGTLLITDANGNTVLSIDANHEGEGAGSLIANNLTIEANHFNVSPGKFIFGNESQAYINFDTNEKTSYIQSINYGASAEQQIYVVDLGETFTGGAIRSNGVNTTKLYSYIEGEKDIYICLQRVAENQYTYITTNGVLVSPGGATANRIYGRWLKCIRIKERNVYGNAIEWQYGYIYPGGSDTQKPTWDTIFPGVNANNYNNNVITAMEKNARLSSYIIIDPNDTTLPNNIKQLTLTQIVPGGGKLDLYNGRLDLNPNITMYSDAAGEQLCFKVFGDERYITKNGYANLNCYSSNRIVSPTDSTMASSLGTLLGKTIQSYPIQVRRDGQDATINVLCYS